MVSGTAFGDTADTCYVGVFRSLVPSQQTIWYMGNIVMNQFYMVFDMSPLETGETFIQVGIAPRNPDNIIGDNFYDQNDADYDAAASAKDQSSGDIIKKIVPIDIDPAGEDFIQKYKMVIIIGAGVLGLVLLLCFVRMCCCKPKPQDPYKVRMYSHLSDKVGVN